MLFLLKYWIRKSLRVALISMCYSANSYSTSDLYMNTYTIPSTDTVVYLSFCGRKNQYLLGPTNAFRSKAIISVNIAEPITAHTIGKGLPSILMVKNSGSPIFPAIHKPRYAPTKPTMIETRHPPKLYPANDWPIAPHIAAIASRTKNPISVMV